MKKLLCTIIVSLSVLITAFQSTTMAAAVVPVTPPGVPPGGGGGAGGFIGFVGFLVSYDLIRRLTCSGDFLNFGGPGFSEPMTGGNVMIPQCLPPEPLHARD